ncbi:hypothetical protein [Staphylococcus xylosus]|uniref:hypothetical protein n=1 Tax=Staphylococcus xylosus TaxID=1288 RepID=UPI002DB82E3D|nr:hypothetical protein [Staphylococcus xylosus]MEB7831000.1 hypothetical protein [Staphylococcus xylosus]
MCPKEKFIGYHGTDKSHYDCLESIECHFSNKLPPDLGVGIYFFVDRLNQVGEAKENAKKYLARWKPRYNNKIIAEMNLEIETNKLMDLDDPINQNEFNLFIDENEVEIYNELDNLINNNTKTRGNIDGLVIEMMIKEFNLDVSAVLKETYTQFDKTKIRKRSNIPNGKELCIREYNVIKKKCISEEVMV